MTPAAGAEFPGSTSILLNLLEPPQLIRHFREHPPEGFSVLDAGGAPAFSTRFDLLTTMEPAVVRRLDQLPLSRLWRRLFRPETCFSGTTVSEYALFSDAIPPESFVEELLASTAPRFPFLIIKDIPTESILAGNAGFDYSRRVAAACRAMRFVLLEGQALAYVPIDFSSTDDFLGRMSHARRKSLRRKLKSTADLAIDAIPTGDARFDDETFLKTLYELYLNVYRQSDIHFDLLTPAFFRAVLQDGGLPGIVFVYRAAGELIGYNLCVREHEMLIDKYVGFVYPQARDYNLYAVSWFHNLDYALTHGLRYYVAGWTDPEVKRTLGARFSWTQHAVYVRNPIVRGLLTLFKRFFESDSQWRDKHVTSTHP